MNREIKVLHITQAMGGVKRYIQNILENQPDYFIHLLISPDYNFNNEIRNTKLVRNSYFIKINRSPGISDLKSLVKIIKIIAKEQPDIIHAHSAKGGVLGRIAAFLTNTPCIFTPNGFSFLSFEGTRRKIFLCIERALQPITSVLLSVGNSESKIASEIIKFPERKIITVSNATTIPGTPVSSYKLKRRVGTIGRLTFQKNPLQFAKLAYEINKDRKVEETIEFVILGAGFHDHLKTELLEYIDTNEISDYFKILNWNNNLCVKDFFSELDIFIMTSIFEGLPFSLLEAMSYGLPCIVSNTNGTKDPIRDGIDGFIYKDFDSLVQITNQLLSDEERRRRIGLKARDSIMVDFNIIDKALAIHNTYKLRA